MELYGKLGQKADFHHHEIMCAIPKYISISRMPPASRAFRFPILRAPLEVTTCLNRG